MIFSNLDTITRRTLLEKGLPIHYYFERLVHHSTAVRELSFDTLKIINTVELPVNQDDYTVDLPTDFVDDVALSLPSGVLRPIPKNDMITPLRYHDSSGAFTPPPAPNFNNGNQGIFGFAGVSWFWNISDYGEATGRYFGAKGASDRNGYNVIKERRQIQLTRSMGCGSIVLMYISDGQSADNATMIDVEAIAAIQAWGNWKASPNADNPFSPQAKNFDNQKRLLRARLSDLTNTETIHVIRRSFSAAMKN